MLQTVELLLLLYLAAQTLLLGHICRILGSKELVAAVQHGIFTSQFGCI